MKRLFFVFLLSIVVGLLIAFAYNFLMEGHPIQTGWISLSINISFALTTAFIILIVVMENGRPVKTIGWILVMILIPIGGIVLYLFFGRNYRKAKFLDTSKLPFEDVQKKRVTHQLNLIKRFPKTLSIPRAGLVELALNNNHSFLTRRNKLSILNNGKHTYDALIEAIEQANHHIHLEYYIWDPGKVSTRLKGLLIDKARQGIEVRLILDAFGSWKLNAKFFRDLKKAGIKIKRFFPIRFPFITGTLNYRNHRKIAIIDGKVGFLGGINIGDKYLEGDKVLGFWRDTHLKIEGEAVFEMQQVFIRDWYLVSKEVLDPHHYYFHSPKTETCFTQILSSGPDSDWDSIQQVYFKAIAMAERYIYIATPYLILNDSMIMALKTAALSGVEIKIIVPEKGDSRVVNWGAWSYFEEFMRAGIKVYTYEKGFIHSKLMIIDGDFISIGTANMDIRSFDYNFEINAVVYQKAFTRLAEQYFEEDLHQSRPISPEDLANRTKWQRLAESISRLVSPLL